MALFRVALTEDEQRVVNAERDDHPEAHVRRKMLVLWLLHCGLTRQKAAAIAGVTCRDHTAIAAALRNRDADTARRLMGEHMKGRTTVPEHLRKCRSGS